MVITQEESKTYQRRNSILVKVESMLIREGFGNIIKSDGTIIQRTYDIDKLVDFALCQNFQGY